MVSADFIVPGDIMRGTMAELRHRGFGSEGAEAYAMDETGLIVGSVLATDEAGKTGWVVMVYSRATNVVDVRSSTFGLGFTFDGEES